MRLTSVMLAGASDDATPPSLGVESVAEVTIAPNDSPRGTITFLQDSYSVQEDGGPLDVVIAREQGTFGQVSVVYFITGHEAVNGEDFDVEPLDDVIFMPDQANSTLRILILDDTIPEVEEEFCIGLRLPREGAILGNITKSRLI